MVGPTTEAKSQNEKLFKDTNKSFSFIEIKTEKPNIYMDEKYI